jgi:4-amino-4-deoxy-L-arabinose transferase-like glycosyltransferase
MPDGRDGGGDRLVIGACLFLTVLLCLARFEPKLHTGGDSAHYVLLAESLLRSGDGYADTMAPGDPVPHTKYPPGYPLMLAPLIALFGRNIPLLKLLSVVLTACSVFVFTRFSKRRVDRRLWLVLCLAFALNPVVVDYSRWILSEAAFLFVTLLAFLFLEKSQDEEPLGRSFWFGLAAIVAAYYIRSIGVVFLVAGTLFYLIRRRWREFLWYNVVGAGLSLPWFIRNQVVGGTATPYIEQFLLQSVYDPEAGYHDLWGMLGRVGTNLWIYAAREMPRVLAGSDGPWIGHSSLKILSLALCGLAVVGFARTVRRRLGVAEIYFALSCLAIVLFEEVVSDVRYLVPLVPLVLVYICEGVTTVARRVTSLDPTVPAVATFALIGTLGLLSQLQAIPENVEMLRRYARGDRYAGYHPAWRSFFEASDWLAANTPTDAVVTVRKPRLVHLWTGRKVVLYPFSTDPDSVLNVVLETDYVMVDQISNTTARYLVPAIQRAADRFEPLYRTEEPSTFVFEVTDPIR